MEKYLDIIRRVLELSDTVLEGLRYVQARLDKGDFIQTFEMLNDVVSGINSMVGALQPMMEDELADSLVPLTDELNRALDTLVTAYEQNQGLEAMSILRINLTPAYLEWQAELNRQLHPLILS